MQKLFNLDKWRYVKDGEAIRFGGEHVRTVRLELNAEGTAFLNIFDGQTGAYSFLAMVTGRDVVEWSQDGPFELMVTEANVMVYTADGQDWSVEPVDDATYTRVIERKARNIELERMVQASMINIEQRSAQMAAENERRLEAAISAANARADAAVAEAKAKPADAGAGDGGKTSEPAKTVAGGGSSDAGDGDAKP